MKQQALNIVEYGQKSYKSLSVFGRPVQCEAMVGTLFVDLNDLYCAYVTPFAYPYLIGGTDYVHQEVQIVNVETGHFHSKQFQFEGLDMSPESFWGEWLELCEVKIKELMDEIGESI